MTLDRKVATENSTSPSARAFQVPCIRRPRVTEGEGEDSEDFRQRSEVDHEEGDEMRAKRRGGLKSLEVLKLESEEERPCQEVWGERMKSNQEERWREGERERERGYVCVLRNPLWHPVSLLSSILPPGLNTMSPDRHEHTRTHTKQVPPHFVTFPGDPPDQFSLLILMET